MRIEGLSTTRQQRFIFLCCIYTSQQFHLQTVLFFNMDDLKVSLVRQLTSVLEDGENIRDVLPESRIVVNTVVDTLKFCFSHSLPEAHESAIFKDISDVLQICQYILKWILSHSENFFGDFNPLILIIELKLTTSYIQALTQRIAASNVISGLNSGQIEEYIAKKYHDESFDKSFDESWHSYDGIPIRITNSTGRIFWWKWFGLATSVRWIDFQSAFTKEFAEIPTIPSERFDDLRRYLVDNVDNPRTSASSHVSSRPSFQSASTMSAHCVHRIRFQELMENSTLGLFDAFQRITDPGSECYCE